MAAKHRTSSRTFIATTVLAALLGVGGCVSYTNVPEPTSAPAFQSANHRMSIKVTRTALHKVISRYPMRDAQGRYSVNLPAGTTLESAQSIVMGLPEGVVIPYEGMDPSIPVYHIGRIWIRASDAKVDVLYPARAFDASAFTGTVTVWMRGGVQPWRVSRVQHWAPGTIPTPPLYVPLSKEAIEARETMNTEKAPAGLDAVGATSTPDAFVQTPEPTLEQQPQEHSIEPAREPSALPEPDPAQMYRQIPVDD